MPSRADAARTFEFWLGRAGSGKTFACLDAIARHVIRQPRGEPLLFLVPEQASASMEHALARRIEDIQNDPEDPDFSSNPVRAVTRARVLSFRLLVEEVFARTGGRPANIVDEQTRILLLRRAIRRRRNELQVFGSSADLPGLAGSIGRALDEFQRFGWRRDDLRERVETLASEREGHEVLRRKLEDLMRIWEDYAALIEQSGLEDLPAWNEAAAKRIEAWDALTGARVFIDGFASFDEEELRLIDAVLTRAAWGCLALCLDPLDESFIRLTDPAAALPPSRPRVGPQRTFEVLERTLLQVRSRLRASGWHTRDQELPLSGVPTRFSGSVALDVLEAEVLTELRPPEERNAGWPDATSDAWPSGPIELLEAPGRREEVEAVARRIAALCHPKHAEAASGAMLDPSEVIVLVRDLENYAPLVRQIFPRYGIPHFIDATRSLHRHPLSRLLLTALRFARTGSWTTELALDYLKSGLAPLTDTDMVARLERLAGRRRLQGRDWKEARNWVSRADTQNEQVREETREAFDAWRRAAVPVERLQVQLLDPAAEPARALSSFLTELETAVRIGAWESACRKEGDEEGASIHERAVKAVADLLLRLNRIGHRGAVTDIRGEGEKSNHSPYDRIDELEEILDAALHDVRGRLIPPSQEQVIVGQIDRSRTPMRIRAAFVMGMADGEFPRAYDEDPVFGDQERKALTQKTGSLGPDSARRYSLERFFAYIALTRASEILVVTRPMQGEQGRPLQPSAPFRAVAEAFPAAGPRSTREDEPHGARALPERPEHGASRMTRDFHRASVGDTAAFDRLLQSAHPLGAGAPAEPSARQRIARVLDALLWPRPALLTPEISLAWWREHPALSATGLEDYGTCAFKFFASRMLRLERPLDLTPGPIELGELRHALLEKLFRVLGEGEPLHWGQVDVNEAARVIDERVPEIARDLLEDRFGRDTLTEVLLSDAVEDIKVFVRVLRAMGERYGFAQVAAEYTFGPHQCRPLEVPAAAGLSFTLRGSVDRVDAEIASLSGPRPNLVLYDFKSAAQASQHSAARYYHGLSLQMAVYALSLQRDFSMGRSNDGRPPQGAPANVKGFFYWPLSLGLARESEGDSAEPASDAWFAKHRAKGLFDAEIARTLDTQVEAGGNALAFGFGLKKDGDLKKTGFGALQCGGFDAYLSYVERLITQRAGLIAAGRIEVEPLATPMKACDLCDFAPVCRIATHPATAYQYLPGRKAGEFRERFEGAAEEDA